MWAVWLNRVGIILNFIAGFLVAPELLGIHRLEWADAKLERFAIKGRERLKSGAYIFKGALLKVIQDSAGGLLTVMLWIPTLFWSSLWWIYHTRSWAWAIIPILLCGAEAYFMYLFSAMAPGIRTHQMVITEILIGPQLLIVGPIYSILVLIGSAGVVARDKLLVHLIRMLEGGNNRVRFLLVPAGIACFIIGNLLQFIATFL
jgi:hypothetical protein